MKDKTVHLLILFFVTTLKVSYSLKSSLRLEILADWGGLPVFPYKTFVELSVGREMAFLASKLKIDAILALGDNFYLNGVKNVDDLRFKETFETAFNYESLQVPWFVIAGNHDYYGNVSAEIAYTKKSDRWFFPDFYYVKRFNVPFSNMTADVVMIDTVLLCGHTDPNEPYKQPLLKSVPVKVRDKHWKWLENTLKSSRANYLLVCGHYPVYSIATHGPTECLVNKLRPLLKKANYLLVCGHYPVYSIATHGPTECLVNKLRPLLKKYNVSAYFSGHDHNLQHIQVEEGDEKMDYFVTGSANYIDPSQKNSNKIPPGSLLFHWGDPFSLGAFSYVDINTSNMTVTFILSNGKVLYASSRGPRFN
ncbi:tartrate-resistant acid phosphatase type 5 [Caerostris darwini]|uniref:Tartrate-resistant acid phosphatase type 5 n=1 Tax=Caerostris darwini TaxID=1538125 RepID=A0AAV4WBK0_9ARAC|nr:tartrate-resistant acid phosphatase type 5 [Caerostris darwini]